MEDNINFYELFKDVMIKSKADEISFLILCHKLLGMPFGVAWALLLEKIKTDKYKGENIFNEQGE